MHKEVKRLMAKLDDIIERGPSALPERGEGCRCDGDMVHMLAFCQLYAEKKMTAYNIKWSKKNIADLKHVVEDCASCLSHMFLNPEESRRLDEITTEVIEKLKIDARTPEPVREAVLIAFGRPKDERLVN